MRPSVLFVLGTGHALTDSSQSSRASSSHSGFSQLRSLWQYHLGPHPHLHLHSRSPPRCFVEVCDGSQGKTIFLPKGYRVRRSHCQNREHPDPRSQRTGVANRPSPDPPLRVTPSANQSPPHLAIALVTPNIFGRDLLTILDHVLRDRARATFPRSRTIRACLRGDAWRRGGCRLLDAP